MATIALVHYTAPPVVGGVEQVLGRQAALLAEDGHAVRIVAGRGGGDLGPDIVFHRLELADTQAARILELRAELAAGRRTGAFETAVATLVDELTDALAGVDLVIAHNVASIDANLVLTAALRRATDGDASRVILWHHDLAWARPPDRVRLHDGSPWSLLRTAWPGAVQVVVSEARRADLARLTGLDPATIAVVPNGVDLPVSSDWPLPDAVVRLAAATDPLFVMPARVAPRKNIELALRLVAALRALGRPAGLVVSGPVDPHDAAAASPAYLDRLLELRRSLGLDDVAWLAATTDLEPLQFEAVEALYGVADALLLPSRDEGFGLPILEAAIRRLPIVCSDLPTLRHLAGDAAIYLDPDGDPGIIAATILDRLDELPVEELAERVRRDWTWPTIHRRYLAPLVARVLADRR